jgi:hypothetical protein
MTTDYEAAAGNDRRFSLLEPGAPWMARMQIMQEQSSAVAGDENSLSPACGLLQRLIEGH